MIKCDISKCHASCCYNAPLPKKYIFALKNRIVNPVKEILVIDDENMSEEDNYDDDYTDDSDADLIDDDNADLTIVDDEELEDEN